MSESATTATPTPTADASAEETLLHTVHAFLDELGGAPAALKMDADLERDLGLGSLERAELMARLEQAFATRLPATALAEPQTPGTLLRLVEGLEGAGSRRPAGPSAVLQAREASAAASSIQGAAAWKLPEQAQTLVDVARFRAEEDGGKRHLRLLDDDGGEVSLTFGELWEGALQVGTGLGSLRLRPGDRVALMLATGPDFFRAFLGVLCAGCVPVPIYPPIRLTGLGSYLERQTRLLDNARPAALIVDPPLLQVGRLLAGRTATTPAVATVASLGQAPSAGVVRPGPEDLGVIQYTSGSTGDPKGVALSQRAMLANIRAIGRAIALGPEDVGINWLPLYHDMGLIGTWWTTLYYGLPAVILTPLQFLSRPERWLWAFHNFRGTASPAPNFAFDLCSRKIPDQAIEGLDLSSWRAALCGAEPVRPETLERFIRRFEPYGFRREAMMPVYGLAETSVALTVTPPGRGPRYDRVERAAFLNEGRAEAIAPTAAEAEALTLVSSGSPMPGHEVRVVEPDAPDRDLQERRQGRILFRSESVMAGYYRRPEATAAVRVGGDWIDTGDLGYLADGELYVTGRIKDLVIKGGKKYHPQDIERAAQRVAGIRQGCVVAFDAPSARGEAIVVIAETAQPAARHEELVREVTAAVAEEIGTPPDRVVLVPPRMVLKTSSGKLKRRETRDLFLEDRLLRQPRPEWLEMAAVGLRGLPPRAAAALRAAARAVFAIWAILALVVIFLCGSVPLLACRSQRACWRVAHGGLRLWARLTGYLPRVKGAAIPPGGAVLVSNHGSYLDALVVIMASERPVLFTAKREVYGWPLIGRVMKRMQHLSVDRSTAAGRLESYRQMAEALRRGNLVHVFPEGTFTRTAGMRPFRLGAFYLAAEVGRPVVPVVIRGTRQALPDKEWLMRPSRIEIEVLEPQTLEEGAGFRETSRLRDRTRRMLAEAIGVPLLEGVPPEG